MLRKGIGAFKVPFQKSKSIFFIKFHKCILEFICYNIKELKNLSIWCFSLHLIKVKKTINLIFWMIFFNFMLPGVWLHFNYCTFEVPLYSFQIFGFQRQFKNIFFNIEIFFSVNVCWRKIVFKLCLYTETNKI